MDMWDLARELGLRVVEHRGRHTSGYRPGDDTIRLTPGMRGRVLRSVLAHEIGHHVLGHHPTELGLLRKRQEAAANHWAAQHLITPETYAAAERAHDGHLPSMAADLYVADELVIAYRAALVRIGDTVYVRPRLGAGMWDHKEQVA